MASLLLSCKIQFNFFLENNLNLLFYVLMCSTLFFFFFLKWIRKVCVYIYTKVMHIYSRVFLKKERYQFNDLPFLSHSRTCILHHPNRRNNVEYMQDCKVMAFPTTHHVHRQHHWTCMKNLQLECNCIPQDGDHRYTAVRMGPPTCFHLHRQCHWTYMKNLFFHSVNLVLLLRSFHQGICILHNPNHRHILDYQRCRSTWFH